jgi:hypothetical protein
MFSYLHFLLPGDGSRTQPPGRRERRCDQTHRSWPTTSGRSWKIAAPASKEAWQAHCRRASLASRRRQRGSAAAESKHCQARCLGDFIVFVSPIGGRTCFARGSRQASPCIEDGSHIQLRSAPVVSEDCAPLGRACTGLSTFRRSVAITCIVTTKARLRV